MDASSRPPVLQKFTVRYLDRYDRSIVLFEKKIPIKVTPMPIEYTDSKGVVHEVLLVDTAECTPNEIATVSVSKKLLESHRFCSAEVSLSCSVPFYRGDVEDKSAPRALMGLVAELLDEFAEEEFLKFYQWMEESEE